MPAKVRYILEGGSSTRTHFFDGSNYHFWKNKMHLFLKSQDNGMWCVITDGDYVPTLTQPDGIVVEKIEAQWSKIDQENVFLNSRAQLFLSYALSMEESERVDECIFAKQV
ncbi:phytoalexin-deficient 4-2 protein [Trifolium medium]|uniref:Phytoalexin-deficient 4-2 protein n=1 Tax=Trifolium medium TaxID=97028 RepID=A0A392MF72_9FABA|nr:phytoalexin-deficient 4-2 protein [Trifolium medium]